METSSLHDGPRENLGSLSAKVLVADHTLIEHDACRKKLTIAVIALRAYSGIWSSASLDSRFRDREGGTTEERLVILNLMRNGEVCTRGADERGFSCTDGKGDAEALAYAPERETDSYHGLVAGTCRCQ